MRFSCWLHSRGLPNSDQLMDVLWITELPQGIAKRTLPAGRCDHGGFKYFVLSCGIVEQVECFVILAQKGFAKFKPNDSTS